MGFGAWQSSSQQGLFAEKLRDFDPIPFTSDHCNLVLGPSINEKITTDKIIPQDCAIHAYLGSTTIKGEKVKILDKYSKKTKKTITLQDAKINVVKHNKSAMEIFDEFTSLVDKCLNLFEPGGLVVCEIKTFKKQPKLMQKKIVDIKNLLDEKKKL